jgi:SAM-dependent methyltransferase
LANVTITSFEDFDPGDARFDVITFVASIHHMDLSGALRKALDLLAPGGELLVVGLAADKSILDWTCAGLTWPFACLGSRLHRETPNIGGPVAANPPGEHQRFWWPAKYGHAWISPCKGRRRFTWQHPRTRSGI